MHWSEMDNHEFRQHLAELRRHAGNRRPIPAPPAPRRRPSRKPTLQDLAADHIRASTRRMPEWKIQRLAAEWAELMLWPGEMEQWIDRLGAYGAKTAKLCQQRRITLAGLDVQVDYRKAWQWIREGDTVDSLLARAEGQGVTLTDPA